MKNLLSIKPASTSFFTGTVLVASAALFVGCASNEPAMSPPEVQTNPIVVGADGGDSEQLVLAEIYAGSFGRSGRVGDTLTTLDARGRIDAVRSGAATMSFGCTGELLGLLDPARARELAKEFAADSAADKALSPTWRDTVYGAFSESLPGEVMATDPSNAQGCAHVSADNPGASLPQHVVPFYAVPALTRGDRVNALNRVAGSLSTKDLKSMVKDVDAGGDAQAVAREWLDTSRFATG